MKTFKFKKGAYIVNRDYLIETKIDSYNYELYIGKNKEDVKINQILKKISLVLFYVIY